MIILYHRHSPSRRITDSDIHGLRYTIIFGVQERIPLRGLGSCDGVKDIRVSPDHWWPSHATYHDMRIRRSLKVSFSAVWASPPSEPCADLNSEDDMYLLSRGGHWWLVAACPSCMTGCGGSVTNWVRSNYHFFQSLFFISRDSAGRAWEYKTHKG